MAKNMHHSMAKVHEAVLYLLHIHLLIVPLLARNVFSSILGNLLETKTKGPSLESKDPINKPKGVVSAVDFYKMHNRKRINKENEGIDSRGTAKKAREEWAAVDATGRTPFKLMHEEDKNRFEKEMIDYHRHNHMDENEGDIVHEAVLYLLHLHLLIVPLLARNSWKFIRNKDKRTKFGK